MAADELFFVEQNARLVKNAEAYYRTMFRGHAASWNLRDRHMVETLGALLEYLCGQHQRAVRSTLATPCWSASPRTPER